MKNKKSLLQFFCISLFFASIFFGVSGFSDAVFAEPVGGNEAAIAAIQNSDNLQGSDGFLIVAFKWLLYGLLNILVSFVQVAASVFAWATRPEYISGPTGLLNLDSVYELWKFVRDFFNLFFIFLLLFSAFATVFQVEQYGLKKNFFKIVFAAIAINFSFPIARIVIDIGNVPMYFFADGIVSAGATKENTLLAVPMAFFQSTNMAELLILPHPSKDGTLVPLLSAVIFTFIFMITLFTLAILFVIRLLKLVVLLIFSPLGVAASIVPGLEKFGKQWWSKLFDTVFFGPAAMLMIVIALRFTAEIQGSGFADGLSATAPSAGAESQASIITQGVFFIPIILMWMAMHMGNKFGIEGSAAVMKKADAVAAWGKKQALRPANAAWRGTKATGRAAASPVTTRFKGYKAVMKDRLDNTVVGSKYWKERGEKVEARAAARAKGVFGEEGMRGELDKAEAKLLDKRAREQEKSWKDDGKTISEMATKLTDGKSTEVEKLAAARFLSNEKEGVKEPQVLAAALALANSTKNKDLYDKIMNVANDDALEMKPDQLATVREGYKKAHYEKSEKRTGESDTDYADRLVKEEQKFDEALDSKFKSKFKKEGKMKVLIDYEIAMEKNKGPITPIQEQAIWDKNMGKMKVKEIAQMQDIYDKTTGDLAPEVVAYLNKQGWTNKMKQDAYSELDGPKQRAWKNASMKPS